MKLKILSFDEILTPDIMKNFLDTQKIELHVSVNQIPTKQNIEEAWAKFTSYKRVIKAYHFNNSIPTGVGFNTILFKESQYERARLYWENNPHIDVFVALNNNSLQPQKIDNFQVATWQEIDEYIKFKYQELNGKREKTDSKSDTSKS